MREVDLGKIKVLEYENNKIYENQSYISFWCLISFIAAILTAVVYVVASTLQEKWMSNYTMIYILFFIYLFCQPLTNFLRYNNAKKPSDFSDSEIDKLNRKIEINRKLAERLHMKSYDSVKNYTNFPSATAILGFLGFEFAKIFMLFPVGLMGVGNQGFRHYVGIWAYHLGYMLPSTIFIYVALIFLIKNCKLMKNEWNANPPSISIQAKEEIQREQDQIIEQKNFKRYKQLIEKCGVRFFIKYYKKIKRLPLRDIAISKNFSPKEREERLRAAKKIIDLNLSEFALTEILKTYSDILESDEVAQAKALLDEIKAENQAASNIAPAEHESEYANQSSEDFNKKQPKPASSQNKDTWDD